MSWPNATSPGGGVQVPGVGWRALLVMAVLLVTLVSALIGLVLTRSVAEQESQRHALRLSLLDQQERLALILFRQTPRALSGVEAAFSAVRHAHESSRQVLKRLDDLYLDDPRSSAYQALRSEWTGLNGALELILAASQPILGLRENLEALEAFAEDLEAKAAALVAGGDGWEFEAGQAYAASNLRLLSGRLRVSLRQVLDGDGSLIQPEQYQQDAKLLTAIGDAVTGLSLGDDSFGIARVRTPEARALLDRLSVLYRDASSVLESIMANTLVVVHVYETGETLAVGAERIPVLGAELRQASAASKHRTPWAGGEVRTMLAVMAMVVAIIMTLAWFVLMRSRVRAERLRAENARQIEEASNELNRSSRDAIGTLLKEVGALADGDRNIEAMEIGHGAEAITTAVNDAVDTLRGVIANLDETSAQVYSTAVEAQAQAGVLSEASLTQMERIAQANDALHSMSSSAARVAQEASESSGVADRSLEIASKGVQTVQDTISGLGAIHETIEKAARRLERFGETSREIREIVVHIHDLTEQTNVLALNASIQASMAVDTGDGFAAVADEVQRLAERAGQAIKRAEGLLGPIETDIHEAMVVMEQGAASVVTGERAAGAAGEALDEVESVSEHLSRRTNAMTSLSREHSGQAGEVMGAMDSVLEAASATQAGTAAIARSVGKLTEVAEILRGLTKVGTPLGPDALSEERLGRNSAAELLQAAGVDEAEPNRIPLDGIGENRRDTEANS